MLCTYILNSHICNKHTYTRSICVVTTNNASALHIVRDATIFSSFLSLLPFLLPSSFSLTHSEDVYACFSMCLPVFVEDTYAYIRIHASSRTSHKRVGTFYVVSFHFGASHILRFSHYALLTSRYFCPWRLIYPDQQVPRGSLPKILRFLCGSQQVCHLHGRYIILRFG